MGYSPRDVLDLFPAPSFRHEYQKRALLQVAEAFFENDYKVVLLQAPTGAGKSLIITAVARAFDSAYLTTPQIPLIDQLMNDPYIKPYVAFVKGREHYPCILQSTLGGSTVTAAQGDCKRIKDFKCPKADLCPYYRAKRSALVSKIAGMTFAYFLYEKGRTFRERELLVVDECHTAENWAFIHTDLEIDTSRFPIHISIPDIGSEGELVAFVQNTHDLITRVIKRYDKKAATDGLTDRELRYYEWLQSTSETLKVFLSDNPHDWIYEIERGRGVKGGDILRLKPLYAKLTLKKYVWWRAKKYLLSSATILDPEEFLHSIGLEADEVKLIDVPSYFPPENRRTYVIPLGKMTRDRIDATFPRVAEVVEKIMRKHEGEKGFIHCHSYSLQRRLVEYLLSTEQRPRIVYHNSDDRNEKFRMWLNRLDDSVFLSVNMTEGIDLKYDLARWQIIIKCPYPSLEDRRVRERLNRKEWHWYNLQTLRTLIQACGRVVRSADDYGVTYILDSSVADLIRRYRKYCPKWFLEQLVFVRVPNFFILNPNY